MLATLLPPLLLLSLTLTSLPQARAQAVERSELPPLPGAAAPDPDQARPPPPNPGFPVPPAFVPPSSGPAAAASLLPYDVWRGVDPAALKQLLAAAPRPCPSPTLATLIARALAAGDPPGGEDLALRVAALQRAGRVAEQVELLGRAAEANDPGALGRYALALLASGREDDACEVHFGGAPEEALLIPVYCAAARGDLPGAKLALQLARDGGAEAELAAAAIARLSKTSTPAPPTPKHLGVIDYLFLTLGAQRPSAGLAAKAEPDLLFLLAHDPSTPAELRVASAERAASLNIIGGGDLARAYREAAPALPASAQSGPALRARLFVAFDNAPSVKIRAESIAALLASARDQDIEVPIAEALAEASAGLVADPKASAFAETGIRIAALAGDEQSAWAWVDAGGERVANWQLLLAASDPQSPRAEATLAEGVDLALKGGLPPPVLHRLVTVLDALNYEVPIPLWNEASKTPQPNDGDLSPTGALTGLKEAADAGEIGRTVLIAAVLGKSGAKGAHLIALGDTLRALKRVGLDAEARRLGFEALYAHWPSRGKA
jgi:hypothetical protein